MLRRVLLPWGFTWILDVKLLFSAVTLPVPSKEYLLLWWCFCSWSAFIGLRVSVCKINFTGSKNSGIGKGRLCAYNEVCLASQSKITVTEFVHNCILNWHYKVSTRQNCKVIMQRLQEVMQGRHSMTRTFRELQHFWIHINGVFIQCRHLIVQNFLEDMFHVLDSIGFKEDHDDECPKS